MIRRLSLKNFKAFESLTITFGNDAVIVGPNNAGKSTVLSAIRACSEMLRYATNKPPNCGRIDRDIPHRAYKIGPSQFSLVDENLRHEFRNVETRAVLTFSNRATLTAVWSADDDDDDGEGSDAYFYVSVPDRKPLSTPREVRDAFPSVGMVPVLSPVEHDEPVGEMDYIKRNLDSRLASRHFRRQLHLLKYEAGREHPTRLEDFLAFAEEWIPELQITELRERPGRAGHDLDLYYSEPGKRAEKEIFWAGDGMQVWLQLILHVFRLREMSSIVLDEPDVYLHADLQRRLVRLLEGLPAQTITATHSAEMLVESAPEAVVWVDKSRPRAVRGPSALVLAEVTAALGSNFNLRLAKALRSRVVLFVEGKDMRVLRSIARTVGATRLSQETGIAVIPLEGYSNWESVEPFEWMVDKLLQKSVKTFVILDRDYRSDAAVRRVTAKLAALDIRPHVWSRKELESYLLVPAALARVTKAPVDWIENVLAELCESLRNRVFARSLDEALRSDVSATSHRVTATEAFQKSFDENWATSGERLFKCSAKEVFRALNRRLAETPAYIQVSVRHLARELRAAEVPSEMRDLLLEVESSLTQST